MSKFYWYGLGTLFIAYIYMIVFIGVDLKEYLFMMFLMISYGAFMAIEGHLDGVKR